MSESTAAKILFVDDEQLVLDAYRRQLGRKYALDFAASGEEALTKIAEQGPFSVVVSDMHMPGMDGIRLLSKVREISPDAVRIMLTGADHQTAIAAVNEGCIFRYLSKPCDSATLEAALEAALAQNRLLTAERALLSNTLTGAVKVLTNVLATVRPVAFGRTDRVRDIVRRLSKELIPGQTWRSELAALLSQMGCVGIAEDVLARAYAGKRLEPRDQRQYQFHPQAGYNLVKNIPRLEQVADIILQQEKQFDGAGFPDDGICGEQLPMEARILKVALDLDTLMISGRNLSAAVTEMAAREGAYDKGVLDVLRKWVTREALRNIMAANANASLVGAPG